MTKTKKEIRFQIGSTDIASRPDATVVWYVDSCDSDRGRPEIVLMDSSEAKIRKIYEDTKKPDSGHYDVHLYIALAIWDKGNECWDIIDDEVIDGWFDEDMM